MHIHLRVHRWVLWWFYVGVACGAVALVNIFVRDLTRTQERVILAMGVWFWLLGGIVCYACEGIQIAAPPQKAAPIETPIVEQQKEWHPASDFVFPGHRRRFLPPKY
jgi:hypothetical protein